MLGMKTWLDREVSEDKARLAGQSEKSMKSPSSRHEFTNVTMSIHMESPKVTAGLKKMATLRR